jgi:hypothetical protein
MALFPGDGRRRGGCRGRLWGRWWWRSEVVSAAIGDNMIEE